MKWWVDFYQTSIPFNTRKSAKRFMKNQKMIHTFYLTPPNCNAPCRVIAGQGKIVSFTWKL